MSPQSSNPSEQPNSQQSAAGTAGAGNAAATDANTGNLADTNSDEYKHEHGGHHHHHHHRHHHRHFHLFNFSISGIRDNLKLLFRSPYTYPYVLLILSLVFLYLMSSGKSLSLLASCRGAFSTTEIYYRWQEFLVVHKSILIGIPFQFTLLVSVIIMIVLANRQERHWQRNVMKLLPALGAAAVFSIPMGGQVSDDDSASCRDCLRSYYDYCNDYARQSDNGDFPMELPAKPPMKGQPDKPNTAAKYGAGDYEYKGAGMRKTPDDVFLLIEDKENAHIGNCRYAIRSDGMMLVSKYGGDYTEYRNPKQHAADQK